MNEIPSFIRRAVHLAPLTTLEVGGEAEFFADLATEDQVVEAFRWARQGGRPVTVLGGGSNVVVSDGGVPGLTVRLALCQKNYSGRGGEVTCSVDAGVSWDAFVRETVGNGLSGLECLVGIPGRIGAAPIQNVGAYGQEVSQTIDTVRVFDPLTGAFNVLSGSDCGFAYRDSYFKSGSLQNAVVTRVCFRLRQGGKPNRSYREVQRRTSVDAALDEVMAIIATLRSEKSMLAGGSDGNHRSAGSFFVNPVVTNERAADIHSRALAMGHTEVPSWPAAEGQTKFAAAWLIEKSGLSRGMARGRVGLSTNHALAVINRGGATSGELLDFARSIQTTVEDAFGVALRMEPRLLGFG